MSDSGSSKDSGMERMVPVDDVIVTDRHRRDMGSLDELTESIKTLGLINAITVDHDLRLWAGGRRLEAFKRLGKTEIPCRVVANLSGVGDRLAVERDENTCRQEMKPSEKASLGMALETWERSQAKERMVAGTAQPGPYEKVSQGPGHTKGATRNIVGAAVGFSGPTYTRAKVVLVAGEQGTRLDGTPLTDEEADAARQALALMDETGRVTTAYNKLAAAGIVAHTRRGRPPKPEQPKTPKFGGSRRKHAEQLRALLGTLAGATAAFDGVDQLDPSVTSEEAASIARDLSKAITSLKQINHLIRERTQ